MALWKYFKWQVKTLLSSTGSLSKAVSSVVAIVWWGAYTASDNAPAH